MTVWKPLVIVLLVLAAAAPRTAARTRKGGVHRPVYKGAIVMDAGTGDVLFADHADEVSPPASMTKLMTYAVIHDALESGALRLGTPVRVAPEDARVAGQSDSTHVGLKTGETFSVEELIYAMMIQSANDAAWALARSTAGTVPAFVQRMNAKARALGMTRTLFRSPNGFPPPSRRIADGDLTTPHDYALLSRYLVLHTDVLRYTRVRSRLFGVGVRFPPTPMNNHNHLLGRVPGVDGLKTGYTGGAGFCLAATAERGGRRIIVVVMDSPDAKDRDMKVVELLDRGFAIEPFHPRIVSLAAPGGGDGTPAAAAPGRPAPLIHFSVP